MSDRLATMQAQFDELVENVTLGYNGGVPTVEDVLSCAKTANWQRKVLHQPNSERAQFLVRLYRAATMLDIAHKEGVDAALLWKLANA